MTDKLLAMCVNYSSEDQREYQEQNTKQGWFGHSA